MMKLIKTKKKRDERKIEKNKKKNKKNETKKNETRTKINIFRYFDVNSFRFYFH